MAFKRKLGSKRSAHPKRKRVSRARHARKSTHVSFAKKVLKVVRRAEKKKLWTMCSGGDVTPAAEVLPTSSAGNIGLVDQIIFDPIQGTADGQRIADRCQIEKVVLKLALTPAPFHATNNPNPTPLDIRFWICHNKDDPQTLIHGNTVLPFSINGQGTHGLGTLMDMVLPLDKKQFVVSHERKFKLGYANYNSDAAAGTATYQYFVNNDYKMNIIKTIDVTKAWKASQVFEDGISGNQNTAPYPTLMFEAVSSTGLALANPIAAYVSYELQFTYTDVV